MYSLGEEIKLSSMRHWSLEGRSRLVKVLSVSAAKYAMEFNGGALSGYITEERFLWGLNSHQIERFLGLRTHELRPLAQIHALSRLPKPNEVEFKFSAAFPDGDVYTNKDHDNLLAARRAFLDGSDRHTRSMTPVVNAYPPGSGMIPQWRLTVEIPSGGLISTVMPTLPFARENGSIKLYTPHNRGPIR